MKKIIIIGATGEVGMYVTDYLVSKAPKENYEIIAVGRRKTTFFDRYGIAYYSVDISCVADFEQLPTQDVDTVICTAATMPGRMEGYRPSEYIDINIQGTLNVLEYCRKVNAKKIIYTQTIRDIGNQIGKNELTDDMPRDFSYKGDHAMYVISKNAAVDMIEHYYQEYGLKRFVFRLPTIYLYSPNEYYYVDGKQRLMGFRHIMNQAIQNNDIELWGQPDKAHDIVYVKDLCQMFWLAIQSDDDGGILNVGTGIPVSLQQQIEGIIEVFSNPENPSKIKYCPEKPNARSYIINIDKAKKILNYEPKYDYISYLRDFKREMEENRFKDLF